jgi:hypothetical protein
MQTVAREQGIGDLRVMCTPKGAERGEHETSKVNVARQRLSSAPSSRLLRAGQPTPRAPTQPQRRATSADSGDATPPRPDAFNAHASTEDQPNTHGT